MIAWSIATRIAINDCMIESDETRDERLIARLRERMGATIASKETCLIELIDR
jgi:hypothetical protein